jgi:peptidoglycan/LPS O-acetylase OafA/YrhL
MLLLAVAQVGLLAGGFSEAMTASGPPPQRENQPDVRPTLSWVAAGGAAHLFLIWPLFLFGTVRVSDRPVRWTVLEGACLLALTIPALAAGRMFANAPAGRALLVGAYFASLVAGFTGLASLARRVPAAGRWVLTAGQVLGLGVPLLVYFLADFSTLPPWLGALSPPLAAAALADGSLEVATPAGMAAVIGWAAIGAIAWGAAWLLGPRTSG